MGFFGILEQLLADDLTVRSVKPLTFPKEFRFATDSRSRKCPCWLVCPTLVVGLQIFSHHPCGHSVTRRITWKTCQPQRRQPLLLHGYDQQRRQPTRGYSQSPFDSGSVGLTQESSHHQTGRGTTGSRHGRTKPVGFVFSTEARASRKRPEVHEGKRRRLEAAGSEQQ